MAQQACIRCEDRPGTERLVLKLTRLDASIVDVMNALISSSAPMADNTMFAA